jgi:hypothetical protein
VCLSFGCLGAHSDDNLAEVVTVEHPDEGFRRFLQTVDDVLAVTNDAIGDAGIGIAISSRRKSVSLGLRCGRAARTI